MSLCDVPGIRVGHAQNYDARTGCTVILPESEFIAGVDVRGSAPGSREIELLKPVRLIQKIHAIVLTGGSAFGLDAATGVQQYLEEQNRGFDVGICRIPIVSAAVLFDLYVGNSHIRPDREMGYQAACNAVANNPRMGMVGAGCGATVGKFLGMEKADNGGLGMHSVTIPDEVVIAALVVVNAFGNVYDPETGRCMAGARDEKGRFIHNPIDHIHQWITRFANGTNTTLAVVATNATLSKEECTKVAQMAQDGVARSINPAHTMYDGDIIFAVSTEKTTTPVDTTTIGACAADAVSRATANAIQSSPQ